MQFDVEHLITRAELAYTKLHLEWMGDGGPGPSVREEVRAMREAMWINIKHPEELDELVLKLAEYSVGSRELAVAVVFWTLGAAENTLSHQVGEILAEAQSILKASAEEERIDTNSAVAFCERVVDFWGPGDGTDDESRRN